jgi:hypothetical protein
VFKERRAQSHQTLLHVDPASGSGRQDGHDLLLNDNSSSYKVSAYLRTLSVTDHAASNEGINYGDEKDFERIIRDLT